MSSAAERREEPLRLPDEGELPEFMLREFRGRASRHCVIVPVLNEGARIRRQLARMQGVARRLDIVLVDGGSTDGATDPALLEHQGIRTLLIKSGPGGLGSQLRIGLAYALHEGYEGVILIDGNDKDDPDEIASFSRLLDEGWDYVQGSRFAPGGRALRNPRARLAAIRLLHAPLLSWAAGFRFSDTTNGFRAMSRKFLLDGRVRPLRAIFRRYELHYYLAIRAARLGYRVVETPVTRTYPRGSVPTKIRGLRGLFAVLSDLWAAVRGRYDP